MIEVRIITTKGCEACRIMESICFDAAGQINSTRRFNDVIVTSYDFKDEHTRQFINRYQVNDYPATFIIKNNEVKDRVFGTTTRNNMIERIEKII